MAQSRKKYQPNPKTEAARAELIARSSVAKDMALTIEAMSGVLPSVNEMLLDIYKQETGCKTFKRFDEWKEAGYKVKAGETAFRVWGSPIKAKKAAAEGETAAADDSAVSEAAKYKYWPMCCIFNESQVEPFGTVNDDETAPLAPASISNLCTGEKVETVVRNRTSGQFGQYIGCVRCSDFVIVDGYHFEVARSIHVDSPFYWQVTDLYTGNQGTTEDRLDLIGAVSEAIKEQAPAQLKKVSVAEFRNAIGALERCFNADRHACVGDNEKILWRKSAFFWMRELEGLTCPRAKAEDTERASRILATVKRFLGVTQEETTPTPPVGPQAPERSQNAAQASTPTAPAGDIKKAEKLRNLADKLTAKIEKAFAPRETNTARRLAQAAHARLDGQQYERTQNALRALADLVEQGRAPAALADINSTKAMLSLMVAKKEPIANGYHGYNIDAGVPAGNSPAVLAAWALLAPKSEEETKAEQLRLKIDGLLGSKIPGFFPSPAPVVGAILDRAQLREGLTVADTSAGTGAILDGVKEQFGILGDAFEKNYTLSEILELKGYNVERGDSLEILPAGQYDRILINPPFEQLQDIDHIRHSYDVFLKAGGRLVAVCSAGAFFNSCKKAQSFRDWFEGLGGEVEDLPEGSFKASGTNVNTKIVIIDKPEATGTDDDEAGENPFVREDYQYHVEAKKDRLIDRAATARQEANDLYERTRKLGTVIPLGQPILVGHHSERKDRAFRARLDSGFRKSFALMDKGDYLACRAATIGTGGIASDDPQAVQRLKEKLAQREQQQARMKAVNAALRKGSDEALFALGCSQSEINQLKTPDFCGRTGYPDYLLQNNNAEIRRLKGRIDELQSLRASDPIDYQSEDFNVSVEDGRVCFTFHYGKPSKDVRQLMVNAGYKFSRYREQWVRKATSNCVSRVQYLIDSLQQLDNIY